MLTLVNGDRITMPPEVSLLFEVLDLVQASPATGIFLLVFATIDRAPFLF